MKPARASCLLASVAALLAVISPSGRAFADDGALVWHTIESEHFVVHYYEPHEDIGRRVATVAERAHRTLVPALGHAPEGKTHIVVTDDTDGANGFANIIPRNRIQVYATAPGPLSSLNDHDDWLYGLVAHEYAHIVHLDTIGGLPYAYNKVFGKTWAPNGVQPRWFIEGLATYEESKRSSGGRVRSALFDTYLRGSVLAHKEIGLDRMSSLPRGFPGGNAAYLYGSHFLGFIADRYGDDKLAAISKEYGWQPVPFGINRAVKRVIGRDYLELYDEWLAYMRQRYSLQRDAVLARGLIEGRKLSNTGESNFIPQYAPDGTEIWWIRSDGHSRTQARRMKLGQTEPQSRRLFMLDGAGDFHPLHDGSGLVFERSMPYRTFYNYGDIFSYRFDTEEVERLTFGARADDPDMSPDGSRLTFAINGSSRNRIAVMPFRPGAKIEVVWQGKGRYDQGYTPVWSPDGTTIAFSAWTTGGHHDIWLVDVATRETTRLTADRAIDVSPCWSSDGRRIFFTSDRSGIYNIYALDLDTRRLRQVTNVLGGTFTFDVSADQKRLVYQGFDDDGYEIYELELDESRWLEPEVYVDDRPDPVVVRDGEAALGPPRDFDPLETLLPNRLTLDLRTDSYGSTLSVGTSGSDMIGRHGWALAADYYYEIGDVGFGGSYSYSRFWPGLRISFGRDLARSSGVVVNSQNIRYVEEGWTAAATVTLPVLRRPAFSSDIALSYDYNTFRNVDPEPMVDPSFPVTRFPETGALAGVALRWSMSNTRRYTYSIGPAEGRTVSVTVNLDHPNLGSDWESLHLDWRWQEYWQLPWWEHIVSLRYAGGIEKTNRRRDGPFGLGGLSPFGTQSLGSAIINSTRASLAALKGYPPGYLRGRQFHLVNLEYRIPIVEIEKGLATVPVYVRRLHAVALSDIGLAADDFDLSQVRTSIGAALRLEMTFGYYAGGTFDLGVARGLNLGGRTQFWLLLTQNL